MGTLLHSCETNVTGVTSLVEREQSLAQIEKLVSSHVLHGSESLCKLLRYLAKHALDHPGTPIKEYQIATEVFGRSDDFDPQLDSMVRVQAGRLRGKLAEYYSVNGSDDAIVVELPRGTYLLAFHHRASAGKPHHAPPVESEWQTGPGHRKWAAAPNSAGRTGRGEGARGTLGWNSLPNKPRGGVSRDLPTSQRDTAPGPPPHDTGGPATRMRTRVA